MRETKPTDHGESGRAARFGLIAWIAIGVIAGAGYVAFDIVSEGQIGAGTLRGSWARLHEIVDHLVPLVAGALLGVAAHRALVRPRLAKAEAAVNRAEGLRTRLQKVERDQAVWVLAAAVLHELNNPLHAIGLAIDELATLEADPPARVDLIRRMRAQSDRALAKLRALRSMRGVGEPQLVAFSLDDVLHAFVEDLGRLVREDGIVVRAECAAHVHVHADPEYVRTIVENLVDNSVQALREGGGESVMVSLRIEGDHAIVRVSDDGPPLAEPLDESVFEPLRSTKQHGLGLGLPISRALARAMRGDLLIDTAAGLGFRLELPVERRA
jgi:signal transduction histidine kinase